MEIIRRTKGEDLTREDLLGKSIWEIYPEAVSTVLYRKYHEAMREHKSVQFEAYSGGHRLRLEYTKGQGAS